MTWRTFSTCLYIPGSCKHLLWQGVRASSAAPYYLADFSLGAEKWQDGAVTCNNPGMLGVMEARPCTLSFPYLNTST